MSGTVLALLFPGPDSWLRVPGRPLVLVLLSLILLPFSFFFNFIIRTAYEAKNPTAKIKNQKKYPSRISRIQGLSPLRTGLTQQIPRETGRYMIYHQHSTKSQPGNPSLSVRVVGPQVSHPMLNWDTTGDCPFVFSFSLGGILAGFYIPRGHVTFAYTAAPTDNWTD